MMNQLGNTETVSGAVSHIEQALNEWQWSTAQVVLNLCPHPYESHY